VKHENNRKVKAITSEKTKNYYTTTEYKIAEANELYRKVANTK
jgi:hypothetical protein